MKNTVLGRCMYRRATSAALALGVVLAAATTQSAPAQTLKTLYAFTGGADGAYPSSLVQDAAGNLYGLTYGGGDPSCFGGLGCGTVFKVDSTGKETVLHTFTGTPDGSTPAVFSRLVFDGRGNLYGNTQFGGTSNAGTVFKLDTTGNETVLFSFSPGASGNLPSGGLILDGAGNLYGTAYFGGDFNCGKGVGCGTVFKLDRKGNQTVLYSFSNPPDGSNPNGKLLIDSAGDLYGTNVFGGHKCVNPSGCGSVFRIDTAGHETVLHAFRGAADGGLPEAGLLSDRAGHLYGTTDGFGAAGNGVVFRLDPDGKEHVLHSFTGGADGGSPRAGLIWGPDGLYGTTTYGGNFACAFGCGTVFKLNQLGLTVLYEFTGGADGANPVSTLFRDSEGNFYGTTNAGGDLSCNSGSGCGTVFKLTP
jgi:uncharacterized repeat protein (TIGR03803 family)